MAEMYGSDAFAPKEVAERINNIGVAKIKLPLLPLMMLGILAGVFIGLGALYFVLIKSDVTLEFALSQVLGGLLFPLA